MVVVTRSPPPGHAVHFAPANQPPAIATGVLLALASPEAALAAARASAHLEVDWAVHGHVAGTERQTVAFIFTLARCVRGRVWAVLDPTRGAHIRIAGHLMRGGCDVDPSWVSL